VPWTTPRTWVTGEILTASNLNLHVRDNLGMLWAGPSCMVGRLANQSVSSSVNAYISFDTEVIDLGFNFDIALPERITSPTACKAVVLWAITLQSGTTGTREGELERNDGQGFGGQKMAATTTPQMVSGAALIDFAAGQYARLRTWHNQGSAINMTARAQFLQVGAWTL
jgi:hypothetical protein